jgi:hypothetical protein
MSSWPGFVPAIHAFPLPAKAWMPATSAGMTRKGLRRASRELALTAK